MFLENLSVFSAIFLHTYGMSIMKNHIRDNKKKKECVFVPRNRVIKYLLGVPPDPVLSSQGTLGLHTVKIT